VTQVVSDAHEPGRLTYATTQDVAPVLELVQMRAEMPHDPEFRPVAEIPLVIVEQLMQSGAWNDPAAMKRWLNDPANAAFRIWRGRV
jgi:hypothetical protein